VGPIIFESHVRVRTDDGNQFADWFRLRQRFTETSRGRVRAQRVVGQPTRRRSVDVGPEI
jgi:hypothetical protein